MRVLRSLGVDLGREESHFPPDADDNPQGYQEHMQIVELDDRLLRHLGGHASEVPAPAQGWEAAADIDAFVDQARPLLAELFTSDPWAFKDPRTSVLLPFWRRVRTDLRVIVCVRHPLEVAESMLRRGANYSREHWLRSWLAHTSAALAASADADRAIVLFDDLISAPRMVADDLAMFVFGEPPELERREAAAAAVHSHQRRSDAAAAPGELPPELARYYSSVRDLARASARSRIAASVR